MYSWSEKDWNTQVHKRVLVDTNVINFGDGPIQSLASNSSPGPDGGGGGHKVLM